MRNYLPVLVVLLLAFVVTDSYAQEKKMKSPPASASGEIDGVKVEINYHQPSARGREMLGGKLPYGKVWRTGANNATTISFSDDVSIEGEELAKGKYSLFTIPGEDSWTIIFNSETEIWGTQYSDKGDVLRVEVVADETDDFVETLNISVEDDHILLAWENTEVKFEVESK